MPLTFLQHSPLVISSLRRSPFLPSPTDWSRIYRSMASRLTTRRYFDRNSASLLMPASVQLILKGESTRQASKRISGSVATIFSSTSESTRFRGGTNLFSICLVLPLVLPLVLLIFPPCFLGATFTRQFCPSASSSRFWRYFRAFFKAIRSFFCLTFGQSCSTSSHLSSVKACS